VAAVPVASKSRIKKKSKQGQSLTIKIEQHQFNVILIWILISIVTYRVGQIQLGSF
jgi:hypothetical protein